MLAFSLSLTSTLTPIRYSNRGAPLYILFKKIYDIKKTTVLVACKKVIKKGRESTSSFIPFSKLCWEKYDIRSLGIPR